MKYTVDTNSKTINIESQMSSEELKGLCEQYPDYSFSGSSFNYVPYYPTTAPIQPYYHNLPITFCEGTLTTGSGTFVGTLANCDNTANLHGYSNGSSTDTTQGFAGKTTTN